MAQSRMTRFHRFCALGGWAVFTLLAGRPVSAADWTIVRVEGREYVPLAQIAAFYGLPKPPKIVLLPGGATVVTPVAPAPVTAIQDDGAPQHGVEPPPAEPESKTITLNSEQMQL